jgi:hypothetical protein
MPSTLLLARLVDEICFAGMSAIVGKMQASNRF